MAFTHTNEIRYRYTTGDGVVEKIVSQAETDGAEMNVSEAIVTDSTTEESDIDLEYFEFTTAAQAKSVYLRLDGFDGAFIMVAMFFTQLIDSMNLFDYILVSITYLFQRPSSLLSTIHTV